jgi:hypothetical protein
MPNQSDGMHWLQIAIRDMTLSAIPSAIRWLTNLPWTRQPARDTSRHDLFETNPLPESSVSEP